MAYLKPFGTPLLPTPIETPVQPPAGEETFVQKYGMWIVVGVIAFLIYRSM